MLAHLQFLSAGARGLLWSGYRAHVSSPHVAFSLQKMRPCVPLWERLKNARRLLRYYGKKIQHCAPCSLSYQKRAALPYQLFPRFAHRPTAHFLLAQEKTREYKTVALLFLTADL